jgi:hypothetical protein
VEVGRGGGGKSPKGSRHLQGKRKQESQKENKFWFSSLIFIALKGRALLERQIRVKTLFNIFLCKREVLIGIVLVSYN